MTPDLMVQGLTQAVAGTSEALEASWRGFSLLIAPVAVTALWQGLAVAGALGIALRLAPRVSATQRFAAWAAGFVVAVAVPLVPLAMLLGHAPTAGTAVAVAGLPQRAWLHLDMRWSMALVAFWAAASLLRGIELGAHTLRLRRFWKQAASMDLPLQVADLCAGVKRLRRVQICSTTELDRPSVIGFFAPRILVPAWLLERLTPGELEQVVLHEAEHLRRGDDWSNLFQKLCLVLFPLNPGLWWMERRLCQEREMACDEGVVRQTRAPRAYAACLASLAAHGLERRAEALSLGAWGQRSELVDRVHRILARGKKLSPVATGGFLVLVGCGLLVSTVELARCPQLVAFVPDMPLTVAAAAQPPLMHGEQGPGRVIAPVTLRSRGASGRTREVAALAQQPQRPATAAAQSLWSAPEDSSARAVVLRAEMPQAEPSPDADHSMILTAWEQVEVVQEPAHVRSDYDTGLQGDDAAGPQPIERFTMTRLIFRIVPRTSVQTPAAQPTARSGWLVLQL